MQILVDAPTKLVIQIWDVEYSKPGKTVNIALLVIFVVIFLYSFNINEGDVLTALSMASYGSSPIFVINHFWLGRQNKFFTFDRSLKKLVVERQNSFTFKLTCLLGIFLIIFFTLSYLSKIKYINFVNVVYIPFFALLMLGSTTLLVFGLFNRLFNRLIIKLIRQQYLFASKVKVSEYWLCHINDVKIQCSRTVGSYGIVSEHCKIILLGALHVEIENDFDEGCSEKLAQYLADRIKVFLAK
ncbi:hypothetical protein [Altericista sp. CCNU0014]|uniref:hypothetical protein n=1 Tax=Altericista sp. CCNU0014 TaxID=3082949 RepID=UPI00384EDF3A